MAVLTRSLVQMRKDLSALSKRDAGQLKAIAGVCTVLATAIAGLVQIVAYFIK